MKRTGITTVLAFLAVAGASEIATAEIEEYVYTNEFVGLSLPVPGGWYVASENATNELLPDAARIMGLDDPSAEAAVAQMSGMVLLMASERPLSSDVQDLNENLVLAAINVRPHRDEISSGGDYLSHVAEGLEETLGDAAVSDIITQDLGGELFQRLDVSLQVEDVSVHMCQLARVHNDYLVILNLSAETEARLSRLVRVADNIQLRGVTEAVDSSPEGQLFREQASLDLSGSSGGSLLRKLGILLMVIGVLSLIGKSG